MSADKAANWTTFVCEWKFHPHCVDEGMIVGGSLTPADDEKDHGPDIVMLGRWHDLGTAEGVMVCKAKDATVVQGWLVNWAHLARCKVYPVMDDNAFRNMVAGKPCDFQFPPYNEIGSEARPGESLYLVRYKYHNAVEQETGHQGFAKTTKEAVEKDQAGIRMLGRWHDPAQGTGFGIEGVKHPDAIYKHVYNWRAMCSCTVVPVLTDAAFRALMQAKPYYESRLAGFRAKTSVRAGYTA